ncbi:MAG: tetratricopeptide repeat protein [Steroidobacteraceae bacterium]
MTIFIAICALFAIAAAALLAWPLLRLSRAAGESTPRDGVAATIVASLLPLAAFAIYFWASNWSWDPASQSAPPTAADLKQMVAQLQDRLARQPDDIEGWKLLGRSATVLGDFVVARDAFGEAYTRSRGQDADAIVGYAESLVLNDEREIDGHAAELFEQALTMAPDNARALWYGGIVAYRRGDLPLAQTRWVELQNHDLPPDLRQVVAEQLSEMEGPMGQPTADAGARERVADAAAVALTVGVAPALKARVPEGSTLFVIARRVSAGPPLAVVRRPVDAWPVSIEMTDADAMLPGTSLAGGGPLRITARISKSGEPLAASGDLFGEVGYDFASAHPAEIVIDRIVP